MCGGGWRAALNVALLSWLFVAAARLERAVAPWWPEIAHWTAITAAVIYSVAGLLAVPPLLASANKFKAAAILFAEVGIPATTPRQTWAVRVTVAGALLVVGTELLALWLLWLLTALDVPWPALAGLGLLFVLVMVRAWRDFVRFYAGLRGKPRRAQAPAAGRDQALAALLRELPVADLDLVTLTAATPIRAGQLKGWTGARVAGLVRDGRPVANAGAETELHAGDQVLLAGSDSQLAAARLLLTEGRLPSPSREAAAPECSPARPEG